MAKAKATTIRIVIDTNWYVSGSINKSSRRKLYRIFTHPAVRIFYCDELLAEYRAVIAREKISRVITPLQSEKWIRLCLRMITKISLAKKVSLSRDPEDNYLLSLSEECKADYLLTGDDDLLIIKKHKATRIVMMKDFIEVLSKVMQI